MNPRKEIFMAFKPCYANAIYRGEKTWEFRKVPPPLFRTVFIYESAPISAVTGWVMFSEAITGVPAAVMDFAKNNRVHTRNLTGISLDDLQEYAGFKLVTALRVHNFERFAEPVPFKVEKAPQNWGRY